MTEPTDIMLDHLRTIRAEMARLTDEVRGLRTEMISMRQHMAGIVTLQEQTTRTLLH